VLVFFAAIAVTGWNVDNFAEFAPFGFSGVMTGAGIVFFSYVGLDAVSTTGEEAKNPRRNLPIAIIAALVVVTAVYLMVVITALGAQPAAEFEGQSAGLAVILERIVGASWPGTVLAVGAVISIFSVTLVVLFGQTRILYAMSRDGMAPRIFGRVNKRTGTPIANTVIVGSAVAVLAGVIPINFLAEMTSIGTLMAFLVVAIAVMVLRRREPGLDRKFRLPLHPLIPVLTVAGCVWIIKDLRPITILMFALWTAVVLVWYFLVGRKNSELGRQLETGLIVLVGPGKYRAGDAAGEDATAGDTAGNGDAAARAAVLRGPDAAEVDAMRADESALAENRNRKPRS